MIDNNNVWLMAPAPLRRLQKRLARLRTMPSAAQLAASRQLAIVEKQRNTDRRSGVAVLGLHGPLEYRYGVLSAWCGGTSTELCRQIITDWLTDPSVKAICLDIDSPGGTEAGTSEFATFLRSAREQKPIYAIANPQMCSAAYWIASAASFLSAIPSSEIGSVGCYMAHVSTAGALEKAGIKITLVAAPARKTAGNPYEPLDDSERERQQVEVDRTFGLFVEAVAKNRGLLKARVLADFGGGGVVRGSDGLGLGMVDAVEDAPAFLQRVAGSKKGGSSAGQLVREMERRRLRAARQRDGDDDDYDAEDRASMTPRSGEDEEEFMDRCMASGKSESECELLWDNAGDEASATTTATKRQPSVATLRLRQQQRERQREFEGGLEHAADVRRRRVVSSPSTWLAPATEDRLPLIGGYSVVYNVPYWYYGTPEQISAGAFDRALFRGTNVKALVNHDVHQLVGSTEAGTLTLMSDAIGLRFVLEPRGDIGRRLVADVRAGKIVGMSFEGVASRQNTFYGGGLSGAQTTIREISLTEITFARELEPANQESCCAVLEDLGRGTGEGAFYRTAKTPRGREARMAIMDLARRGGF
jgi:HK97 family phage prohead protease